MRTAQFPPSAEWRTVKVNDDGGVILKPTLDNGSVQGAPAPTKRKPRKIHPTLDRAIAAAEWSLEQKHGGSWSAKDEWRYEEADGSLAFIVVRFECGGKSKEIRQFHQVGDGWSIGLPAKYKGKGAKRPLYRLRELPDSGPVFVVEGERTADAGASHGLAIVTSCGGSKGASYTGWSALNGRDVVILPDADEPGRRYATTVAAILQKLDPDRVVKIVDLPDLADGDDLVEFIEGQPDGTDIAELIETLADNTEPYVPTTFDDDGEREEPKKSQATIMTELALAAAELFHDADREAWATIPIDSHGETHRVKSKAFRLWLQGQMFGEDGRAAGGQSVQDAINTISAHAIFAGPTRPVHVRVAEEGDKVFIDLADTAWRVVEIDAKGWRVLAESPVKFSRPKGMEALPVPVKGGSIKELRQFVNVRDDDAFVLLIAFIVGALRPRGPYPVLELHGEHGTCKSTLTKMIRALVDPNSTPIRAEPRNEHDLVIAARGGQIVAFDNLSFVPIWLSDAMCRLSTGGGFATRELYTDADEILFNAMRPQIMNGITELATRPDLLDRQISLELKPMPDSERCTEGELWERFNAARPRMLGALYDAVSTAMRKIASVKLVPCPRMADFSHWVCAAEPALPWSAGEFLRVYGENRAIADELSIEHSPIGPSLLRFIRSEQQRAGTADELLNRLAELAGDSAKSKFWPKGATPLGNALSRLAPSLRHVGIDIERSRTGGTRFIHLTCRNTDTQSADRDSESVPNDSESVPNDSESVPNDRQTEGSAVTRNGTDGIENGDRDSDDSDDSDLHTSPSGTPAAPLLGGRPLQQQTLGFAGPTWHPDPVTSA